MALLVLGLTWGVLNMVHAAAPAVKTQPGFYRMMVGDIEVTALNDGVVSYSVKRVIPAARPEEIRKGLFESGLRDPIPMSYNAFLINTGRKLVLIDTGTGGKLDDQPEFHGAGHLLTNLRAAGYTPDQVDEIYITHRGQDHIGGLTVGTERAYPNALVRAPQSEMDLFLDPAKTIAALEQSHNDPTVKAWLQFTRDLFEPYIKAGKFRSFDEDISLTPGIRALGTHGHTPGHTSYIVESRGQTLIVMGDLVLMGSLQFANPTLGSSFDSDPQAAAQQRMRVFHIAAENGYVVAGSHLSFPGIGRVHAVSGRYVWVPVEYEIPR